MAGKKLKVVLDLGEPVRDVFFPGVGKGLEHQGYLHPLEH